MCVHLLILVNWVDSAILYHSGTNNGTNNVYEYMEYVQGVGGVGMALCQSVNCNCAALKLVASLLKYV